MASSVPRRSGLTHAQFLAEYASKNQPVVLEGERSIEGEPLSIDYLRRVYGTKRLADISLGDGGHNGVYPDHIAKMPTLADYLDRLEAHEKAGSAVPTAALTEGVSAYDDLRALKETREGLPYLTNLALPTEFPELAERFREAPAFGKNWLRAFPAGRKLASGELFIGPGGTSYGELHFDRGHMFVASYQLVGRKRWTLYPPSASAGMYARPYPGDWYPHFSPVDDRNPDLERYPRFGELAETDRHETVLEPGDILFCPGSWWHNTQNLTTSMSIAVRMVKGANVVRTISDFAFQGIINGTISWHAGTVFKSR